MNSTAVLALIGDLYAQLAEAQERLAAYEGELEAGEVRENGGGGSPSAEQSPSASADPDSG